MGDMYTDIERSIERKLVAAIAANSYNYPVFNNMISKKDIHNQGAGLSIMKSSDTFQPANGGGVKSVIRTPILVNGIVTGFEVQDWPDPYDLLYQLTVIAVTLPDARKLDQLIRDTLRPQKPLMLWDSAANAGDGAFTDKYVNYQYAGYVNRDVPDNSTYWRVTNIRFEAFSYQDALVTEPAITNIGFAFDVQQGIPVQQNQVQAGSPAIQQIPPTVVKFAHAVFPTGARNGVNTVYTIQDAPQGLVLAYLNGQFIPAQDVNSLVNWTLVGNVFTTVSFVLKATDEIVLVY